MSNHQSSHQELTAHLMSVLAGTSNATSSAAAPATENQLRHLISGASSVVSSSNSLSSGRSSMGSSTGPRSSVCGGTPSSLSNSGGSISYHSAAAPMEEKRGGTNENQIFPTAKIAPSAPAPAVSAPAPVPGLDPMILQMSAPPHPVAEFLFQLTKMLTDNNSEYIEWRNASIFVHDPPGLEREILPKYFRHSNYSSFQRQMNYFGFRKIAGKGKMAPCSYVNEAAKEDISSLLFIKRKKTGVSSAAAKLMAQQNRINRSLGSTQGGVGMGVGSGNSSLMMGNTLGGALPGALPANSSLSLNNFSMMGAGGAGNIMSAAASSLNEANILSQQQQQHQMLTQLQQAHASALSSTQVPGMSMGGIPQAAQNKAFNIGLGGNNNGGNNTTFLPNDQGSVYTNSNNPTDWSNSVDAAAAQSLFLQQATQGLAGNFSQGMSGGNGVGDSNGLVRLDSAANLRALINQQISMFNNPSPVDFASAMSNFVAPLGAPMPSAGIVQPQGSSAQQGAVLNTIPTGNASQGVSFDWNEMLQRMGGVGGMDNAAGNASASLQQLLQGSNNGAPGPAPSQPFNFNGLFGPGGGANGAQGPFSS
mmetsp:Transcript_29909/g.55219  ORF Transcript_29909/g.55219 Transcript_29909/m.55219 type:complete len:590 (-) Transcript_29909:211-1980(-)